MLVPSKTMIQYARCIQAGRCLINTSLPGLCHFCGRRGDEILQYVNVFGDLGDGTLVTE
jgi:hypothetical protein